MKTMLIQVDVELAKELKNMKITKRESYSEIIRRILEDKGLSKNQAA